MVRDHRIETYTFSTGSLVGANFDSYTWRPINGILMGVAVADNNFTATGSLSLTVSGLEWPVWSMVSGTTTGNVSVSGIYYPRASMYNRVNVSLSGTNSTGVYDDIPLMGIYRLVGSGLGASKSGTGFTLVYRMG